MTGCLREAIYLIGVTLARAGRIDDPDHALHLALDELRTAVADDGVRRARARARAPGGMRAAGGERPEVHRGDILVVSNVGPDWTPLIPLLGGIVLDPGAVFQHAALVAREYRVPAVLMTREGTEVIVDGQLIAIDGDEGVVDLAPGQNG